MMQQGNCEISTDNQSIILDYDCFSRGLAFTTLSGPPYQPVQRTGIHKGIVCGGGRRQWQRAEATYRSLSVCGELGPSLRSLLMNTSCRFLTTQQHLPEFMRHLVQVGNEEPCTSRACLANVYGKGEPLALARNRQSRSDTFIAA